MKKTSILLSLFMLVTVMSMAQTSDSTRKEKINFKAGLQFISDQTYAGRSDSLKLPVLIPSFTLHTAGGFYTKVSGYVNLSYGNTGFDGVSIEPGYEISKEHWDVSFSLIKNFINDSSNLIIAPVKTSLEFYVGNRNKIINPYAGAEYLFSTEGNDFIMYGGLSKSLLLTKKDKEPGINLEPSISLTGGTQTFFYSYLKNNAQNGKTRVSNASRGHGRRIVSLITATQTVLESVKKESQQFSLLSAEAELPLTISAGKFECNIDPAWVSPVNVINKGGAGTELEKPYWYLNVELTFSF